MCVCFCAYGTLSWGPKVASMKRSNKLKTMIGANSSSGLESYINITFILESSKCFTLTNLQFLEITESNISLPYLTLQSFSGGHNLPPHLDSQTESCSILGQNSLFTGFPCLDQGYPPTHPTTWFPSAIPALLLSQSILAHTSCTCAHTHHDLSWITF